MKAVRRKIFFEQKGSKFSNLKSSKLLNKKEKEKKNFF